MTFAERRELQIYSVGEHRMFGAKTFFMDRMKGGVEEIVLPPAQSASGFLELALDAGVRDAPPPPRRGKATFLRQARGAVAPADRILIDIRHNFPENWAHTLNNFIPLALLARHRLAVAGIEEPIDLIVNVKTPGYIAKAIAVFGFGTIAADGPVTGRVMTVNPNPLVAIRGERAQWVRAHAGPALDALARTASSALPAKIFVSRRDSRRLLNDVDIEARLAKSGFVKVYPETLSIADQFALFQRASAIVGIHGAGIAPMLFRTADAGPFAFLELLNPGHMTGVYRMMTVQVGGAYAAIRGRLSKEMIDGSYDFDRPFRDFSLADFHVDLESLNRGLDLLGIG